jgi:hypothetical protein
MALITFAPGSQAKSADVNSNFAYLLSLVSASGALVPQVVNATPAVIPAAQSTFAAVQSGIPTAIVLPAASGNQGQRAIIKDSLGVAALHPITITSGGGNIEGGASLVINNSYGSVTLISDGTRWSLIAST